MHMEDEVDESVILTKKQKHILFKVIRNLLAYFGVYFLSQQIDKFVKQEDIEKINMTPAMIGINVAFAIQMFLNYTKKAEIKARNKADDKESQTSLLSAAGLTTLFNAMTQTTTTLCANGQCFTIYSNTIASNLAAFGVSVTSINTYLVPLCCCLLGYSIWSLYREKRSLTYKPFLLGVLGSALIILDNFVLGESLNL